MKRVLSFLLILASLMSLVVLPAAAADEKTVQQAVVETAQAYYRKGIFVQYDSTEMTYQDRFKSGVCRLSTGDAPEMAAADQTLYTVCSDFCYDVYYDAFGYKLLGNGRVCQTFNMTVLPTSDPTVMLKFGVYMDDVHTRDRQEFMTKCQEIWQPGDVIVVYARTESGKQVGGHAMLYVGDITGDGKDDILHSTGGKIEFSTGVDTVEKIGSITLDNAYDLLFNPETASGSTSTSTTYRSSVNINLEKYTEAILLRPSKDPAFPKELTASAKSRLQYPGLDIDRSADRSRYNSLEEGDKLTVTVTLKNTSAAPMTGISVKETLPDGSKKDWTVDLVAGEEKKLSYTVDVTAKRGGTLTLPGGTVADIPTRPLSFIVGGEKLTNTAALAKVAADGRADSIKNAARSQTDFANEFYESVLGIDLGIPTKMSDVIASLFTVQPRPNISATIGGESLLVPRTTLAADGAYLASMLIPDHLAGTCVYLGAEEDTMRAVNRTMEFQAQFYEPGDIFLCTTGGSYLSVVNDSDVVVYIYLGDGKVASQGPAGVKVMDFADSIGLLFKMNVLIGLRPSLAQEDINASATAFAFTDVKENAWYYSYVKSLVIKGVVSGMTKTTYAPNGNLTYGQALKLITLAVGEKEPAAENGHWAGGYLSLARSKGWLDTDIDLNANITRLAFCRIAAKAAGISQQPAVNPFTDTADTHVLALYNAGVINGMSAASFGPDGLLTRAQIAKIIWCLETL